MDVSHDLLKKIENCKPLLIGNIERFPFKDNHFDVIYGCSILHHLDVDTGLQEIHRILRPGGLLVLSEPNLINPQIFVQKHIPFLKSWMGDVPHETAFSRWSLAGTLTRLCFDSIEVRPFDFLYPWTPKPFIPLVASIGAITERIPGLREIAGSLFIVARKKREGVQ